MIDRAVAVQTRSAYDAIRVLVLFVIHPSCELNRFIVIFKRNGAILHDIVSPIYCTAYGNPSKWGRLDCKKAFTSNTEDIIIQTHE